MSGAARVTTRLRRIEGLGVARGAAIVLAGLFLGGIIHVAVVMSVPHFVPVTAYARVAGFGQDGVFNRLPDTRAGAEPLPMLDPMMLHAACRFDLAAGPLKIEAAMPPPFWSFALFNARGEAIYSLNDRTSGNDGKLDVLVITTEQLSVLREDPPPGLEDLIVIETVETLGYALLRSFDGDPMRRDIKEAALAQATCRTLDQQ
ncbi:DUF1254 domain-containing protein [Stappia sp. ES.058]|uniref:DUF1254 domain-containing protein n=1 Tax=Stappia sp. ES.058 TaxID=1881061 RepID=UPI00087B9829|nr:hypothetical protein [Stappia sp. ES.058]SDT98763.1 Uncharacterized membrane protein [Stappia sp. ES.058]